MPPTGNGRVVIVSGPSGAGKTTVMDRVFQRARVPLRSSVSATTRPPRPGETGGVNYHFLSKEEFETRRQRDEFLECAEVFGNGDWYGTLRSEVAAGLRSGKWVVLKIDVQGALALMEQYPDAITIFVGPSSMAELERRLRGRGTETEASIRQRLARARDELSLADRYRYQVVNDQVDRAAGEICNILESEWERNCDD